MPVIRFKAHGAFTRYFGAVVDAPFVDGDQREVTDNVAEYLLNHYGAYFTLVKPERVKAVVAEAPSKTVVKAKAPAKKKAKRKTSK